MAPVLARRWKQGGPVERTHTWLWLVWHAAAGAFPARNWKPPEWLEGSSPQVCRAAQVVGLAATPGGMPRAGQGAPCANSGFGLPLTRVIVKRRQRELRKKGPAFDLPIALGLLLASGQLAPERLRWGLSAGELGLVRQPAAGARVIALGPWRHGASRRPGPCGCPLPMGSKRCGRGLTGLARRSGFDSGGGVAGGPAPGQLLPVAASHQRLLPTA